MSEVVAWRDQSAEAEMAIDAICALASALESEIECGESYIHHEEYAVRNLLIVNAKCIAGRLEIAKAWNFLMK